MTIKYKEELKRNFNEIKSKSLQKQLAMVIKSDNELIYWKFNALVSSLFFNLSVVFLLTGRFFNSTLALEPTTPLPRDRLVNTGTSPLEVMPKLACPTVT